jgi:hypothetical protein
VASKATASGTFEVEGYEGHFGHFDGGYTVGFETYTADADPAPLFKGLPDDRCQCPHWGCVIKGKLTFTFADGHEKTYESGDADCAPPGHTPRLDAGSEVVEFHPTTELAKTMEVVERNIEAWARSRPLQGEGPRNLCAGLGESTSRAWAVKGSNLRRRQGSSCPDLALIGAPPRV